MKFKLKPQYYNYLIKNSIEDILSIERLDEKTFSYKIRIEEKLSLVNPFIYDSLINSIRYYSSGEREDQDYYLIGMSSKAKSVEITYSKITKQTIEDQKSIEDYLKESFIKYMESKGSSILEGDLKDNHVVLNDYLFDINDIQIVKDNAEILRFKILDKEAYRKLARKNPQTNDLKYIHGDYDLPNNSTFVTLLKNDMIIGVNMLAASYDYENTMACHALSIVPQEQGSGYSSLITEATFEYLSSIKQNYQISLYSDSGFERLRRKNYYLAKQYNVKLYENGLLGKADTLEKYLFYIQNKLEKDIKNLKDDQYISLKEYVEYGTVKPLISEFIALNLFEYQNKISYLKLVDEYENIFPARDYEWILEEINKLKN